MGRDVVQRSFFNPVFGCRIHPAIFQGNKIHRFLGFGRRRRRLVYPHRRTGGRTNRAGVRNILTDRGRQRRLLRHHGRRKLLLMRILLLIRIRRFRRVSFICEHRVRHDIGSDGSVWTIKSTAPPRIKRWLSSYWRRSPRSSRRMNGHRRHGTDTGRSGRREPTAMLGVGT